MQNQCRVSIECFAVLSTTQQLFDIATLRVLEFLQQIVLLDTFFALTHINTFWESDIVSSPDSAASTCRSLTMMRDILVVEHYMQWIQEADT